MFKKKGSSSSKRSEKIDVEDQDIFSIGEDEDFFNITESEGDADEMFSANTPESDHISNDFDGLPGRHLASSQGNRKKSTLLLLAILLALGGYAAYVYILPQYFPDLVSVLPSKKNAGETNVSKRIGIKPPAKKIKKESPKSTKPDNKIGAPDKKAAPEGVVTRQAARPAVEKISATVKESALPETAKMDAVAKAKDEKPSISGPVKEEVPGTGKEKVVAVEEPLPEKKPAAPNPLPVEPVKKAVVSKPRPAGQSKKPARFVKAIKSTLHVSGEKGYFFQFGVYIFKESFKDTEKRIESLGYKPRVEIGRKTVKMSRIMVGNFNNKEEANSIRKKLQKDGFDATLWSVGKGRYALHVASYYYEKLASEEKILLDVKGYDSRIERTPIKMKVYHLLLGPYKTPEEVAGINEKLKRNGLKAAILLTS